MADTTKTIRIVANVEGNAAKALADVTAKTKEATNATGALTGSIGKLVGAVGGMALAYKGLQIVDNYTKMAMEELDAQKKLEQAYGKSAKGLIAYASQLQKVTTFGDEVTVAGMAQLAMFIKDEEQIKRLIPLVQDLAEAKGMELEQAASLVAKSVAGEVNALGRYGIQIEGAAGSTERMTSMAKGLEKAFGGMAKAMAQTDAGKIKQAENAISDMQEMLGKEMLPALVAIKEAQLAWFSMILDNKGAVVGAISSIANLIQDTIIGWDWLLGGERRADLERISKSAKDTQQEQVRIAKEMRELQNKGLIGAARVKYDRLKAEYDLLKSMRAEEKGGERRADLERISKSAKDTQQEQTRLAKEMRELQNKGLIGAARVRYDRLKAEYDLLKRMRAEELARIEQQKAATQSPVVVETIKKTEEKKTEVDPEIEASQKRLDAWMAEQKFIDTYGADITASQEEITSATIAGIDAEIAKLEEEMTTLDELAEKRKQNTQMAFDLAQQTANGIADIMSAVRNKQEQDYDNEIQRRKEDVQNSNMSEKQKAKAIERIEKDAAKMRHEMRMKEWRSSLLMSVVNTALGISKTWATVGYPAAIPLTIAMGVQGAIQQGIIMANKPKMYNGGQLVSPTGMKGDVVPFVGRAGEQVITPAQQRELYKGNNVTISAPQITINGNATPDAIRQVQDTVTDWGRHIEYLFTSGQINASKVKAALR